MKTDIHIAAPDAQAAQRGVERALGNVADKDKARAPVSTERSDRTMSILDTFPAAGMLAERASVVNRAVGTFHFDVVTSEGHDSTLRLTENPIESGAAVADHAVLEPKEITINGVMVGV